MQPRVGIVGGGPVGMTLALELGRRGVPCVLFEQRRTTTAEPRCTREAGRMRRAAGFSFLELIAVLSIFCVFPGAFPVIAYIYAAICLYTALSRIILAGRVFNRS